MSLSPRQRGVRRNFRRRHDDDDDFTDKVFFGWSFFFRSNDTNSKCEEAPRYRQLIRNSGRIVNLCERARLSIASGRD